MRVIKENLTAKEANDFLFAMARILHPDHANEMYDRVQDARTEGNWDQVVRLALNYVEILRLAHE